MPTWEALLAYHLTIGALVGLLLVFRLLRAFEIPAWQAILLVVFYAAVYPYVVYRVIDRLDDEWFEEAFE